jgi:hypothetical protein
MKIVTHNFLFCGSSGAEATPLANLNYCFIIFLKRRTRDTDGNEHHGQVHFSFFPFPLCSRGDAEYIS